MIDAMPMKNTDNHDHELAINGLIPNMDSGMNIENNKHIRQWDYVFSYANIQNFLKRFRTLFS